MGLLSARWECFRSLPPTDNPRHTNDAGSASGAADGYKGWLAIGIEELGRDVAAEIESYWMVPLLVEAERDRLIGGQLGVSI